MHDKDSSCGDSYRPIALTSTLSKIFEWCITSYNIGTENVMIRVVFTELFARLQIEA